MDYYIGKHITEAKQREGIRRSWQRQFAKAALSCCVELKTSLFGRIKSALQIQSADMCCVDTA